jgi:hypothetical protein
MQFRTESRRAPFPYIFPPNIIFDILEKIDEAAPAAL